MRAVSILTFNSAQPIILIVSFHQISVFDYKKSLNLTLSEHQETLALRKSTFCLCLLHYDYLGSLMVLENFNPEQKSGKCISNTTTSLILFP